MVHEQRDRQVRHTERQTGRLRLVEQEASCLPALPQRVHKSSDQVIPNLSSLVLSDGSIVNSPWCCNVAAALSCVCAKQLIFILVTHTNRTAERNVPGDGWQLFQNVMSVHLRWPGLGEKAGGWGDKRAP